MCTLANVKTDLDDFSLSKNDSNNLDTKLKVFRKDHKKKFRLVRNLTMGEVYFAWVLGGCDDYIICTINWIEQISLEFRKWLVHKDFVLKDTKLLV